MSQEPVLPDTEDLPDHKSCHPNHPQGAIASLERDLLRILVSATAGSPTIARTPDRALRILRDNCTHLPDWRQSSPYLDEAEERAILTFFSVYWGQTLETKRDEAGRLIGFEIGTGHCGIEDCCGPLPVWYEVMGA